MRVLLLPALLAAVMLPAALAPAGPLEKYQLPQYQMQQDYPSVPATPEVYQHFEAEIRDLPREEKVRLTEAFLQRQQAAMKRQDFEQVRYYNALIEILARHTR